MGRRIVFDIKDCSKCDIAVNNSFIPGRGEGCGDAVLVLKSTINRTEHKQGVIRSKPYRRLYTMLDKYNYDFYTTSLIKCITSNKPTSFQCSNCLVYLRAEVKLVNPKIVITIGDMTTRLFTNKYDMFKPFVAEFDGREIIVYPIPPISQMRFPQFENFSTKLRELYINFVNKDYL